MTVGIGVIAYHATHDLMQCLRSIRLNTKLPYTLVVCDNSEGPQTMNAAASGLIGAELVSTGVNHGCAVGRNLIWKRFTERHPQMEFMVIMDQDVRVLPLWLEDMLELMHARKNAGVVCWPCANMGERPVRKDGCISKAASVCHLHRMEAVAAVNGWDPTFFMYRFDSLFADRLNNAGWRTYIQMKYYQAKVPWIEQRGGIIHDHPHQGIRRNPNWTKFQRESDAYYKRVMKTEGWTEFDPMKEPESLWDIEPHISREIP